MNSRNREYVSVRIKLVGRMYVPGVDAFPLKLK